MFSYLMDEETVHQMIVCPLVVGAVMNTEGDMRVESFTNFKDYLLKLYTVKSRCLEPDISAFWPPT